MQAESAEEVVSYQQWQMIYWDTDGELIAKVQEVHATVRDLPRGTTRVTFEGKLAAMLRGKHMDDVTYYKTERLANKRVEEEISRLGAWLEYVEGVK